MQHRELKKTVEYHVTNGVTQKIFCFSHFINLIYINRFKEEVSFQTDSSKVRVGPFSGSLCFMKKKMFELELRTVNEYSYDLYLYNVSFSLY